MAVIHWTEIELFHNIRKCMLAHPELLNGANCVNYTAKVKLHGTNCAIQCHSDGRVIAQSRTTELAVGNDNAGFARWVADNEGAWRFRNDMVIFGEWIGPGVQKGVTVAVGSIPRKSFAVFAARPLEGDKLVIDPQHLQEIVKGIPDTYVIPWHNEDVLLTIDWSQSDEELAKVAELINGWVSVVEEKDPWTKEVFGVEGTGEGLVFYPRSDLHLGVENFKNLAFKAKGEKHRVLKAPAAVQLTAEVARDVDQFVDMVLTEARLEQGALTVNLGSSMTLDFVIYDKKLTGKFVAWVLQDVMKEAQDELEASKLDWKQVQKPLSDKARSWYLSKF